MRNVTSHDVARLAGVSQPTVSRALMGQRGVSPETRRRIETAVKELGYVPNIAGRNLSTKRTNVIGIVVNELENPFFVHLIDALHSRLEAAGYRIFLYTDEYDEGVDFTELADGTIAGVVLSTANLDSRQPLELLERGLPCVLINRGIPDLEIDSSVVDNYYGGRIVADLLAELGHRRIGAVLGPSSASTSVDREAGLRAGLLAHNRRLTERFVMRGSFSIDAGREAFHKIFGGRAKPPTALMCVNDTVALGVLDEARRAGVDVPGELTVIGYDDIALASMASFGLTTVHCDLAQMAIDGAELLLRRLSNPQADIKRIVHQPSLKLRSSHAAPTEPPRSRAAKAEE